MSAVSDPARSKRWLAVLLSLLAAGLGHVYAGRPLRALLIAIAVQGVAVLASFLAAATGVVWLAVAAAPLVVVLVAVDAARTASRPRSRWFTRRALVGACTGFLLASFALGFAGDWARERWGARPFRSPSGAMSPTLLIGDHYYVDPGAFRERDPQRGEVVVFAVAKHGPRAHPAGSTFVDDLGRALDVYSQRIDARTWKIADDPGVEVPDPEPFIVPQGRYYVLGDNRDHSKDSRYWGTVARTDLIGPVTRVYWSWDFKGSWNLLLNPLAWWELLTTRTRWERIGLTVQ
jgi:signal peptidase I